MASAQTGMTNAALVPKNLRSLSDEELLDRFLAEGAPAAEAAFEALMHRHGPMVMGVCRQILTEPNDAEDAFQATFLVLARRAVTISNRRVLSRWLYEVACRVAVRAKTQSARRRTRERQGAEMSAVATVHDQDPAWNELRSVLHEEVNRLPERYRSAVVLCYFEGWTNEEAAELLNWPVGTVKGRLSRARDMLFSRLTRRGLVLSAAFLATCFSNHTVFAEVVPSRLVDATVRAAVLAARGGSAGLATLDPWISDLVDNALSSRRKSLLTSKSAALMMVALAAAAVGIGLYVALTQDDPPKLGAMPVMSYFSLGSANAACHSTAAAIH